MSRNVLDVPLALRPDPDPRRPAGTDDAKTEKSRARLCGPRAKLLTAKWVYGLLNRLHDPENVWFN